MAEIRGAIVIETELCKGCELCVDVCPHDVIAMSEKVNYKGYPYVYTKNLNACTGCANCGIICPDAVISVYRHKN